MIVGAIFSQKDSGQINYNRQCKVLQISYRGDQVEALAPIRGPRRRSFAAEVKYIKSAFRSTFLLTTA